MDIFYWIWTMAEVATPAKHGSRRASLLHTVDFPPDPSPSIQTPADSSRPSSRAAKPPPAPHKPPERPCRTPTPQQEAAHQREATPQREATSKKEAPSQKHDSPPRPDPFTGRPPKDPGSYTVIANPPRYSNIELARRMVKSVDKALLGGQPKPDGRVSRLLLRKEDQRSQLIRRSAELMRERELEETLPLDTARASLESRRRRRLGGSGSGSLSSLAESCSGLDRKEEERKRKLTGPDSGSMRSLPELGKEGNAQSRSSRKERPKTAGSLSSSCSGVDDLDRSSSHRYNRLHSGYSRSSTSTTSVNHVSFLPDGDPHSHAPTGGDPHPHTTDGDPHPHTTGEDPHSTDGDTHPHNTDLTTYRLKKPSPEDLSGTASSSRRSSLSSRYSSSISVHTLSTVSEDASTLTEGNGPSDKPESDKKGDAKRPDSVHSWLSWPQTQKKRPPGGGGEEKTRRRAKRHASALQKTVPLRRRSFVVITEEAYWRKLKVKGNKRRKIKHVQYTFGARNAGLCMLQRHELSLIMISIL